ncbi:hypothetical protein D3C86_1792480 [compost metagenome]
MRAGHTVFHIRQRFVGHVRAGGRVSLDVARLLELEECRGHLLTGNPQRAGDSIHIEGNALILQVIEHPVGNALGFDLCFHLLLLIDALLGLDKGQPHGRIGFVHC